MKVNNTNWEAWMFMKVNNTNLSFNSMLMKREIVPENTNKVNK
jgi:hypothetical protein